MQTGSRTLPISSNDILRGVFQAIIVIVSILMAFGIDTWWTELEEEEEALALLHAFKIELEANIQLQEEEIRFRQAKLASARRILSASSGVIRLEPGEIDSLINDVTHWGSQAKVVGALSALIDSGKLAWIDSTDLRAQLAQWPDKTADLDEIVRQDRERLEQFFYPYLATRASFPKISNAWRGRPGDSDKTIYALDKKMLPDPIPANHMALLDEREFIAIVTMISWDQGDAMLFGEAWLADAREFHRQIDTYLANQ